jgi:hypothetical protein
MDVVATGVHETVSGGEGRARLLLDGQGVELGPHRDGLSRRSDARQETRTGDDLCAPGPEGFPEEIGGGVLLVARFRNHMQPLAQFESSRKLRFQGMDEHPEKINRHAGMACRPLSARLHTTPPFLQASAFRLQASARYL